MAGRTLRGSEDRESNADSHGAHKGILQCISEVEVVVMDMGCPPSVCGEGLLQLFALKTISPLYPHTPNVILLSLWLPDFSPSNLPSWMRYQQVRY